MRYRLRTLLMMLAVLPPALGWGWSKYAEYRERERLRQEWNRELDELEKLRSRRYYPNMQLDVF